MPIGRYAVSSFRPVVYTETIMIKVTPEMKELLQKVSTEKKISISQILREGAELWLNQAATDDRSNKSERSE